VQNPAPTQQQAPAQKPAPVQQPGKGGKIAQTEDDKLIIGAYAQLGNFVKLLDEQARLGKLVKKDDKRKDRKALESVKEQIDVERKRVKATMEKMYGFADYFGKGETYYASVYVEGDSSDKLKEYVKKGEYHNAYDVVKRTKPELVQEHGFRCFGSEQKKPLF